MKICHFGWCRSSHVWRWVRWFASRGHESHIITDKPGDIEGVKEHIIPSLWEPDLRPRRERFKDWSFHHWRLRCLRVLKWARDRVNEINPDVVHSHMLWYPGMLGAFVPSKKYVITAFNGDVSWRKDRKLINRIGVRYAIHKADIITSVSHNLLEDCRRWGARNGKLYRIMRGVDIKRFHPCENRDALKSKLGLHSGSVILSSRSAGGLYNLDTIVKATSLIIKKFPDIQIVFVWQSATDDQIFELRKLTVSLRLEQNIIFFGEISYDNMYQYYQAADILVSVPSTDGVSSSIIEGMACGTVPVASNLPTVKEWVEHGKNGLLVEPRDIEALSEAVIDLLKNEKKRKTFAERNLELIKEIGNQDYWMGKMEELYYRLITNSR